jgi:hypothetical protein
VDLPDQVGQPGVPDRSRRRGPGLPLVLAGLGNAGRAAGLADADPVIVELGHEAEPFVGGTTSSTAAAASRRILFPPQGRGSSVVLE